MDRIKALTSEALLKRFKSQFEIVNYAIKRAQSMVNSGRAPMAGTDTQNSAYQVLAEISTGKDSFDVFDTLDDDEEDEAEQEQATRQQTDKE